MGMIVSFSPELRTWILHNLDRGCAVADLVARMVDQKFEPGIARELVETFVHARAAGIDPPPPDLVSRRDHADLVDDSGRRSRLARDQGREGGVEKMHVS